MKLNKYGDILIDLDEVTLLIGSAVVMKDGKMYDIGVKAADAIRSVFTPLKGNSENETYAPNPDRVANARNAIAKCSALFSRSFPRLFRPPSQIANLRPYVQFIESETKSHE